MKLIITETDIIYTLIVLGYILYEIYTQKNLVNAKAIYFKTNEKGKTNVRPFFLVFIFCFLILAYGIPIYPSFDVVSLKYWLFFLALVIFEVKKTRSNKLLINIYPIKHLFMGNFGQKIFAWMTLACIIILILLFLGLK